MNVEIAIINRGQRTQCLEVGWTIAWNQEQLPRDQQQTEKNKSKTYWLDGEGWRENTAVKDTSTYISVGVSRFRGAHRNVSVLTSSVCGASESPLDLSVRTRRQPSIKR